MSALARFSSLPPRSLGGAPGVLTPGRRARLLLRSGLMALAGVGLVAGSLQAAVGALALRQPAGQALATAPMAPRWTDIIHPIALYDLAGTAFAKLPAAYQARHREPDGSREDIMTFGRLGDAKPYLQLSLLRAGPETVEGQADGLADSLARLAGTRGLTATRIRTVAAMDTRFGPIEAADLLLWDRGASTPCLGFRGMAGGGPVLRLSGFSCGPPGRPIGRAALACALDRVDLISAGDDAPLREVFVSAERRGGTTCRDGIPPGSAISLLTAGRRLGWLEPDGAMPPLRGLFGTASRQR